MMLIESDNGLILLSQDQLKSRVQADLQGSALVDELLADRGQASAREDGA